MYKLLVIAFMMSFLFACKTKKITETADVPRQQTGFILSKHRNGQKMPIFMKSTFVSIVKQGILSLSKSICRG